jgi:hypothetical protein
MRPKFTNIQSRINQYIESHDSFQIEWLFEEHSSKELFDDDEFVFGSILCEDHELANIAFDKRTKENHPINKEKLLLRMYHGNLEGCDTCAMFRWMLKTDHPTEKLWFLIYVVGYDFFCKFDSDASFNHDRTTLAEFVLELNDFKLHKFIISRNLCAVHTYTMGGMLSFK